MWRYNIELGAMHAFNIHIYNFGSALRYLGPIWGRQDPGGPHVGPMNFAIWDTGEYNAYSWSLTKCKISWSKFLFHLSKMFKKYSTIAAIIDQIIQDNDYIWYNW